MALAAVVMAVLLPARGDEKPKPKLPPEVEAVFGMALAAPPEFAASALLQLSSQLSDKELRRRTLDMAFHVAAGSTHPYVLESLPGAEADTRSSSTSAALRSGLDRLNLQSRAVIEMLAIDAATGRQLFGEITRPALPAAGCQAALLPNVSAYYEALGAVERLGFSDKDRAQSEHVSLVVGSISRISSLREVEPAARLIATLNWPGNQFEIAVGTLQSRIESLPLDSRSFMASANAIDEAMSALVARIRALGGQSDAIAGAYRNFLVAQFRGPRCTDAELPSGRIVQTSQRLELFGADLRGELEPLSAEEMSAETVEGEVTIDRYWQSEPAQRIFQECMKLRQGPDGINYSEAQRRTREWTRLFSDLLNSMAAWKVSDEEAEADYFHQKATVYEALLELTPSGDSSDRLIASFVGFLKNSNLQQQNPVEWFLHAKIALNRLRASHPDQAAKLAAAYRASGSIVLVLESMLNEVAPQNPFFKEAPAPARG